MVGAAIAKERRLTLHGILEEVEEIPNSETPLTEIWEYRLGDYDYCAIWSYCHTVTPGMVQ
jgi:hypothetical protein